MRTPPPVPTQAILDPYIGLRPYTDSDDDCARFKGREQDPEIIIANLYATSLTVFYGASGVGKSSALLAGVVPSWNMPRFACEVFRTWQSKKVLPPLKAEILNAVPIAAKKETSSRSMPRCPLTILCSNVQASSRPHRFDLGSVRKGLPLSRSLRGQ